MHLFSDSGKATIRGKWRSPSPSFKVGICDQIIESPTGVGRGELALVGRSHDWSSPDPAQQPSWKGPDVAQVHVPPLPPPSA